MKLSKSSLGVLVIQLALVSLLAGSYLYQRWTCPRVWTRTMAVDPERLMRGRYLSLHLMVDACPSTLEQGMTDLQRQWQPRLMPVWFAADLKVENGKLKATRHVRPERPSSGQQVGGWIGQTCDALTLREAVDFYIAEHAADPTRLKAGQELWVEVTVPPDGPPRPVQLALKDNGVWKPLAFE